MADEGSVPNIASFKNQELFSDEREGNKGLLKDVIFAANL
jgi:hypothetical protein